MLNEHITHKTFIDGPVGKLEAILAEPTSGHARGVAVIAHPHPLYGGTMNNKVVHTLFKSFLELGFIAVKFNFRGVEQSEGEISSGDNRGAGEVGDVLAVAETLKIKFAERFTAPVAPSNRGVLRFLSRSEWYVKGVGSLWRWKTSRD